MLRRFTTAPAARLAAPVAQRRTYFVMGAAEEGAWGTSMRTVTIRVVYLNIFAAFYIYNFCWRRHNPDRQWVYGSTDLWEDDGTVMEGEEAVANLRIQRERIMPMMEEYEQKIAAATE
jgi:hypothetical protein